MMIGEPDVILLDEPFSALDSYLKDVLQRDMKEFLKDYKGDMVLVTHSREEAFQFCRELTLLKDGGILVSGETKSIFDEPGSVEAARLTGWQKHYGNSETRQSSYICKRLENDPSHRKRGASLPHTRGCQGTLAGGGKMYSFLYKQGRKYIFCGDSRGGGNAL